MKVFESNSKSRPENDILIQKYMQKALAMSKQLAKQISEVYSKL